MRGAEFEHRAGLLVRFAQIRVVVAEPEVVKRRRPVGEQGNEEEQRRQQPGPVRRAARARGRRTRTDRDLIGADAHRIGDRDRLLRQYGLFDAAHRFPIDQDSNGAVHRKVAVISAATMQLQWILYGGSTGNLWRAPTNFVKYLLDAQPPGAQFHELRPILKRRFRASLQAYRNRIPYVLPPRNARVDHAEFG